MVQRYFFCLLMLSTLLLTFASASADELRGDRAAASAGWEQIDAGALVIDVRSEGEYANGHLPDARRIDYTDTDALAAAIGSDKTRSVVLYCGSGRRAERARGALLERGYENVFNAGGLDALQATQPH